jgi:ribosomal protein S19
MTRSVWKGPFVDACLFKQKKIRKGSVGLKITEEMVGHKFGEFASTRKPSSSGKRASPLKTKIKQKKKVR